MSLEGFVCEEECKLKQLFPAGYRHGRVHEPDWILRGSIGDAAVLLPVDPARRIGARDESECTIRSLSKCRSALVAGFRAARCCDQGPPEFAVAAFAITLNTRAFFTILGASIVLLWLSTRLIQRNARDARRADP